MATSSLREDSIDSGSGTADSSRRATRTTESAVTVASIAAMSSAEVDALFRRGHIGAIPDGKAQGTAVFKPGANWEPEAERVVRSLFWQGKVFDARRRTLKNLLLPFGVPAIAADVYPADSWFDGAECIVLDYSKRSLVARAIRDEIRLVAPGLYLGLVYWGKARLIYFTLRFPS
jgi:hypothetical protein